MAMKKLYKIERIGAYRFADLPKGDLCVLSINPYNGNVLLKLCNRPLSGRFAFSIMSHIVEVCSRLAVNGSDDPLSDLLAMDENGRGELFSTVIEARKVKRPAVKVLSYGMKVNKAS